MKARRIDLEAQVEKYKVGSGLEDGFERWSDIVTDGWIRTMGQLMALH